MKTECRLVAMPLETPSEDSNLIKVKRQAWLGWAQRSHKFRNLLVWDVCLLVSDPRNHICTDNALAFSILANLIGHIYIYAPGKQPTCVALGIANQPPILHWDR